MLKLSQYKAFHINFYFDDEIPENQYWVDSIEHRVVKAILRYELLLYAKFR